MDVSVKDGYMKIISIKFVKNIKFNLASAFFKMNSYITIDDIKIEEDFFDNVNISTTDTTEHILSIWSNPSYYSPGYGENLISNIKISTEEKSTDDEKIIVFSDDEKIFEDIIDNHIGKFEYEFNSIKDRNIKIYISNKKDNTNINISDIKYASNNSVEIECENKNILSDNDLHNNISIQDLINIIRNNYSLTNSENNKINDIYVFIDNKDSLLNLDFPIERPITLEQVDDSFSDISDFIYNSVYGILLTNEERNLINAIINDQSSTLTIDERKEILMNIYNKYEINEEMYAEKENKYKEYLINLYRKYAGNRNIIQKYKSDDIILESLNMNELFNKVTNASDIPLEQNERVVINNISNFMNNKNSLMNLQFPIERPIGNKIIHGGRVYVFK